MRSLAKDLVGRAGRAHIGTEAGGRALIAVQDPVGLPGLCGRAGSDECPALLAVDRALGHAQFADLPIGQLKLGT